MANLQFCSVTLELVPFQRNAAKRHQQLGTTDNHRMSLEFPLLRENSGVWRFENEWESQCITWQHGSYQCGTHRYPTDHFGNSH